MLIALTGCGTLIPKESNEQAAIRATDSIATQNSVESHRQIQPEIPSAEVITYNNEKVASKITLPAARQDILTKSESSQGANSKGSLMGGSSVSIPLGVKIILIALGIGSLAAVVFGIIKYAKSQSPAIAAALSLADRAAKEAITRADQVLAKEVQKHRDEAIAAKTAEDQLWHQTQIANLETERGKLVNSVNNVK
mgnify:CR=1 FL=1